MSQSSSCGKSGDVDSHATEHNAAKRSKAKLFTCQIYSPLLNRITSMTYLITSSALQFNIGHSLSDRFSNRHTNREQGRVSAKNPLKPAELVLT
jgi:hypothetical protein